MIGRPVTVRDGQRGATAGVAVQLGQDDAGEVDALHGTPAPSSTASWPIIASMTNSTSSGWTASRMSAACCMSSSSIAEAAGGVDDDDVVLVGRGPARRRARATATGSPKERGSPVHRRVVAGDVARLGREHRHAGALADDLQLGDRVRPLQVGGDQQRGVPLGR